MEDKASLILKVIVGVLSLVAAAGGGAVLEYEHQPSVKTCRDLAITGTPGVSSMEIDPTDGTVLIIHNPAKYGCLPPRTLVQGEEGQ